LENFKLAFYFACSVIPVLFFIAVMLMIVYRRSSQVILCMECDQCMGVCPVLKKRGKEFLGPRGIMEAVKSGNTQWAISNGALMCTSCGLCARACPRGLAPWKEIEKWGLKYRDLIPEKEVPVLELKIPTVSNADGYSAGYSSNVTGEETYRTDRIGKE